MGDITTSYSVYSDSLEIYAEYNFDYYYDPETGEALFDLYYSVTSSLDGYGYSGHSSYPGYSEFYYFPADVDISYTVEFYAQETWSWDSVTVAKNVIIARNAAADQTVVGTGMDDIVVTGVYNDTVSLGAGNDWLDLSEGNDTASGGTGADTIMGAEGDDVLAGNEGDDVLYGGQGNDTVSYLGDVALGAMSGVVVDLGATIATDGFGDTDRLYGIENVVGSTYADMLTGDAQANRIDGAAGADTMIGLGGGDRYEVDNIGDIVDESVSGSGGTDLVHASVSVDLGDAARFRGAIENVTLLGGPTGLNASGNALGNLLTGNGTRNILDGRGGADLLRGLGGDDIYYVDHVGDVVDEAFAGSGGMDLVYAGISINLADSAHFKGAIERATLLAGTGALNLTGNAGSNVLTGNESANRLNGGSGADTMRGLDGDDTYRVDDSGDVVDESLAGSGGIDTVQGSISIDLTDTSHFKGPIERVLLQQGYAGLDATGNGLANVIIGNAFGNAIKGKGGNDILTGGLGVDRFVFDTALNAATNVDTITDYNVADDTILLDNAIFALLGGNGTLAANLFKNTASGAVDADDRIIYDSATGALIYDINGSAAGGATRFATLSAGLAMSFKDFAVI